ncbi:hypothetical protein ACLESO_33875 [Pyxidicoccus sp. 3LG]
MAPRRFLSTLPVVLAALLAAVACAGPTGKPPEPPSAYTIQQELGQRDVIQAGSEYARNNAFVLAEAGADSEAVELRPNLWRVRFALADQPGRFLEMEFDELARQVTRAQVIEIIPGSVPGGTGGSGRVPPGTEGRGPFP